MASSSGLIRTLTLIVAFSSLLAPGMVGAAPLEIIHTNDLHSHLDHARDPARGGYAAVKAAIDRLKSEARAQGIDTLTLDAGDFTEDSQFYLADQGLEVWKAMDAMGYDAVELGNHDWLMGLEHLDELAGIWPPSFAFLSANLVFGWEFPVLGEFLKPSLEVERAGSRIAILGLTTDDLQYAWRARPGRIEAPESVARARLPGLRSRNDYVIALTHLGVDADESLVQHVRGIDLVVGGHSHTELDTPDVQKDPDGKEVAIVQAGMHGNFVGDLLVDLQPGKPLQILRYQLVPVYSQGPQDAAMARRVDEARKRLDGDYGRDWLDGIVGTSDVPLENAYYQPGPTEWSRFVGEAMREAGKTEATLDVSQFEGYDLPAGPIRRVDLFTMYPRIFGFENRLGYTIWTAEVRGWLLQLAVEEAVALDLPVSLTGITARIDAQGHAHDVRINGRRIDPVRNYRLAMPEALPRGAFGISKFLRLLIKDARDTGIPIWTANERRLKAIGGLIHASPAGALVAPIVRD
jgi:2',3'-cyclic-nucleotide 2'-phosphodiesterase (5'-nucleotidase family)